MYSKEKVLDWIKETDGYSILSPNFFTEMGMPDEMVKQLSNSFPDDDKLGKNAAHRSDGDPGPVSGIAEFDAIDAIALGFGIEPCHTFFGRGKNFWETAGKLKDELME